tara:strand:+ start:2986 stop:3945 length:960 start_codon:yes stop_codon:yes gene_type:complete
VAHFWSSAKRVNNANIEPFVSIGQIAAFFVAVIVVFVLLFPRYSIWQQVTAEVKADPVTENYLANMIRSYPNDDRLRIQLALQQVGLGHYDDAKETVSPLLQKATDPLIKNQVVWVYYLIQYDQTLAMPKDSEQYATAMNALRNQLRNLAQQNLTPHQLGILGRDALSISEPQLAVHFYSQLFQYPYYRNLNWLVIAAKAALSIGAYQQSASFYLAAEKLTNNMDMKRFYLVEALNSLRAGNLLNEALDIVDVYYSTPVANDDILIPAAQIAIAADEPSRADKYLQKILWIPAHLTPSAPPELPPISLVPSLPPQKVQS